MCSAGGKVQGCESRQVTSRGRGGLSAVKMQDAYRAAEAAGCYRLGEGDDGWWRREDS